MLKCHAMLINICYSYNASILIYSPLSPSLPLPFDHLLYTPSPHLIPSHPIPLIISLAKKLLVVSKEKKKKEKKKGIMDSQETKK